MRLPEVREEDRSWREWASCVEVDPELFFPSKGEDTKPALRVCAGCPVDRECLDFALRFAPSELPGVWGGATPRKRARLRRELRLREQRAA